MILPTSTTKKIKITGIVNANCWYYIKNSLTVNSLSMCIDLNLFKMRLARCNPKIILCERMNKTCFTAAADIFAAHDMV